MYAIQHIQLPYCYATVREIKFKDVEFWETEELPYFRLKQMEIFIRKGIMGHGVYKKFIAFSCKKVRRTHAFCLRYGLYDIVRSVTHKEDIFFSILRAEEFPKNSFCILSRRKGIL